MQAEGAVGACAGAGGELGRQPGVEGDDIPNVDVFLGDTCFAERVDLPVEVLSGRTDAGVGEIGLPIRHTRPSGPGVPGTVLRPTGRCGQRL
ncbi:hypothetical protein [Streptomyces sp. NPDC048312]|uniref:hypothetical protein n=1 Tax=Streptomyces sp. NPDC048312 TaxID=3155485 RepID=UPI0033CF2C8C